LALFDSHIIAKFTTFGNRLMVGPSLKCNTNEKARSTFSSDRAVVPEELAAEAASPPEHP
jgi:hypothetical protein